MDHGDLPVENSISLYDLQVDSDVLCGPPGGYLLGYDLQVDTSKLDACTTFHVENSISLYDLQSFHNRVTI